MDAERRLYTLNLAKARSRLKMPLLMKVGMGLAALFPIGAVILLALAALGIGSFRIGNRPVAPGEWLRLAGPLFVVTGALMAAVAYACWKEKPWSRHLALAHWAVVGLYALLLGLSGQLPRYLMWRALIETGVLGAFALWYFYAKRNVVEYFRALRARLPPPP